MKKILIHSLIILSYIAFTIDIFLGETYLGQIPSVSLGERFLAIGGLSIAYMIAIGLLMEK